MSYRFRRMAPSYAAMIAAGLVVSPAIAATTTIAVPANTTQTTVVTASPASGDTVIVDVDGALRGANATAVNSIVIDGAGAGSVVVNNDGRIQGRFNLPGATGPITVNNNTGADPMTQGWHTSGVTTFGSGADAINNGEDGVIAVQGASTFAFGGGSDSFTNAGRLIVDRQGSLGVTLTITGLETFNNSGLIVMGSVFNAAGAAGLTSDNATNDRILAQGVAFTGSGDSRVALDVALGGASQLNCSAAVVADCLNFTGGSTAGSTLLTVNTVAASVPALGTVITLVAGSSAEGDFTLDPASEDYAAESFGAALQQGALAYRLVYDAGAQMHQLVAVLSDDAVQQATSVAVVQDTWRATSGTWFSRQADLRAVPGGVESSKGVWARIGTGVTERDVSQTLDTAGFSGDYNLGYQQRISQLVFGGDVLRGSTASGAWVAGAMAGFVRTDVEHDATDSEAIYSGFTGGFYGSYVAGPLFVDALFNFNLLDAETDAPGLDLGTEVKLTNRMKSLGGQIEAGWRFDLGPQVTLEPLAGLSYVTSRFKDVEAPEGVALFDYDDNYTSFRIGGGLRLAVESELVGLKAAYALTGRYWDEQEGENASAVVIINGDDRSDLVDAFTGGFSRVTGSVNLFSDDGAVSGFAELGGEFGDDYQAANGAIGVRVRW